MDKIQIKLLRPGAKLPTYGSREAAGADLYACLDTSLLVQPGQTVFVPTGIAIAVPSGFAGLVYARSGLSCKRGLAPANKVGVIDADYRGEVMVALHNHSSTPQELSPGDRIAQLVITPVLTPGFIVAEELPDTTRGEGGFGSTGF